MLSDDNLPWVRGNPRISIPPRFFLFFVFLAKFSPFSIRRPAVIVSKTGLPTKMRHPCNTKCPRIRELTKQSWPGSWLFCCLHSVHRFITNLGLAFCSSFVCDAREPLNKRLQKHLILSVDISFAARVTRGFMHNEGISVGSNVMPILIAGHCYWMRKFREL